MHVAIVGGGCAGVLTLAQLVRAAKTPLRISLIEKDERLARGIAYGTPSHIHLLNVKAGNMSAFPDSADAFARWAGLDANVYASRRLYGDYLASVLQDAQREAALKSIHIDLIRATATALEGRVLVAGNARLEITHLVLATGNFLPQRPSFVSDAAWRDARLIQNPWAFARIVDQAAELPQTATIAVLGTGLTTVDVLLSLRDGGYRGRILCLSRHGLLPAVHRDVPAYAYAWPALIEAQTLSAARVLHEIRCQVKNSGVDWRAVMNSLRPITAALWQKLPTRERKKVFARLFTYWNVHRHRVPPEAGDAIDAMRESGVLQLRAARIRSLDASPQALQIRIGNETLPADCVINATGPGYAAASSGNALLTDLLDKRYILPHETGLGLAPGAQAPVSISMLGALLLGERFETTAVPEIRVEARDVARSILESQHVCFVA